MPAEPLYKLEQISKTYTLGRQKSQILSQIDLTIDVGEFVAIMGPSGSGKTTLLNLLGGLDRPTSGALLFNGERIDRYSETELSHWRATSIGFIFQFYNLMPSLTAAQNVELPLLLRRMSGSERRRRVATALDIVGLGAWRKHYPRQLSGGQMQRVAIARAIISDPAVLLCDEPTGDLDRATSEDILQMLKMLNTEFKKTILMVTHDANAACYANYTISLDKGVLIRADVDRRAVA